MTKLRKPRIEDKFFLAMCYWKLGQKAEAEKHHAEAIAEFTKNAKPGAWLTEIKQEAEALISASKQPAVR